MRKILTLLVIILLWSGQVSALLIDDFTAADGPYTVNATTPVVGGSVPGAMLGGTRSISVEYISGPFGGTVLVGGGVYNQSEDAFTSISSTITWDAGGAGLGGIALAPVFMFDVLSIDQGNVDVTFFVTDVFSMSDSVTMSNVLVGTNSVSFSGSSVDFMQLDSVSMQIVGGFGAISDAQSDDVEPDGVSLSFGSVRTIDDPNLAAVPLPAALWLFAVGGISLLGFSRSQCRLTS